MPKYLRIAQQLRSEIETRYSPGVYLPSERTLQKTFDVTPKTIRSALDVLVQEGLVETFPYRGTVVRAQVARTTDDLPPPNMEPTGKTVALVMPLETYLVVLLARGVERELRRHGYRLQLCGTYNLAQIEQDIVAAQAYERQLLESLTRDGVVGAIWWSAFGVQNRDTANALQEQGIPLVLVDNPVPGLASDTVGIDDYGAAFAATQHLLDLGHTNIAFWGFEIGDFIPPVAGERLAGFLDAVREASASRFEGYGPLPISVVGTSRKELTRVLPPAMMDSIFFYDENSIEAVVRRDPRPSAVIVASDHLAHDFILGVESYGLRVPEDIAVVSFGDIDRHSRRPSVLTTVRQPFEEMGARAVRLLLQRLKEPGRPQQHVYLPTELIIRQTCGAGADKAHRERPASPIRASLLSIA